MKKFLVLVVVGLLIAGSVLAAGRSDGDDAEDDQIIIGFNNS